MKVLSYFAVFVLICLLVVFVDKCSNDNAESATKQKIESMGGHVTSFKYRFSNGPFHYRAKGQGIYSFTYEINGEKHKGWMRDGDLFGGRDWVLK